MQRQARRPLRRRSWGRHHHLATRRHDHYGKVGAGPLRFSLSPTVSTGDQLAHLFGEISPPPPLVYWVDERRYRIGARRLSVMIDI